MAHPYHHALASVKKWGGEVRWPPIVRQPEPLLKV
jgi:hypothetical protein